MAIELETELPQGGSANYWDLDRFYIHRNRGGDDTGEGVFFLYNSAEDAAAGKISYKKSVRSTASGGVSGSTTVAQIVTALENAAIAEGGPLEGGTKV
jgi:hypothetical protein